MLLRSGICRAVMQWRQPTIKSRSISTGMVQLAFVRGKYRFVARWEEKKADNEARDVEQLRSAIMDKLANGDHAAVTDLQLFIDGCTNSEHFPLLQETLKSYRQSKSVPYDGLPTVLLRACIRLGRLDKALDMIKDKVTYGVFPDVNGYNFLMDELMNPKREIKNPSELTLNAYTAMVDDDIKPNKTSNALRIEALIKRGSVKDLKYGSKLFYEFMNTELKVDHIRKLHKDVIYTALRLQQPDLAIQMLKDCVNWSKFKPANLFCHLYVRSLKEANRESEILDIIEEHVNLHPKLKLKRPTIALMREATAGLENADQNARLDAFEARLQAENRILDGNEST